MKFPNKQDFDTKSWYNINILEAYLDSLTGGKVIREPDVSITTSPLSDALSADLKRRGMTFVGSTTIYAFLQAIGAINAHSEDCFRYGEK